MYVCMYVRICICICIYLYIYINIHVYKYIYIIYMCIHERALLLFCIAVLRRIIAAASSNCGNGYKPSHRRGHPPLHRHVYSSALHRIIAVASQTSSQASSARSRRTTAVGSSPRVVSASACVRAPSVGGYSHVLQGYCTGTAGVLERVTIADYSRGPRAARLCCARTRAHTTAHAHAHARAHAHAHTHAHTRARTHTNTHTRTGTHTHTRARAHTHTRARAHTHTSAVDSPAAACAGIRP
jgi:hypothetical protein